MNDKEKTKELARLVKAAERALREAENFADLHGLDFYFAPSYGMGGTYVGKPGPQDLDNWKSSSEDDYGWQSSSSYC